VQQVYRRLASFIDRVLRGAKPAELPVELPTLIEHVINLRSARALGLSIPRAALLRADEVIE
jgi:putative ABC transport system substrate-binding protein